VKSPVLFLSVLSSLHPPVCALLLLCSAARAAVAKKDHLQSHRDGAGGWLGTGGWPGVILVEGATPAMRNPL